MSRESLTKLIFLFGLIGLAYGVHPGDGMNFKVIRNPDCDPARNCTPNVTKLIQVVVENAPANSIHFLLPGNISGAPLSVILIEAAPEPPKIQMNWTNFNSRNGKAFWNSIVMKDIITSYGVVLYNVSATLHFSSVTVTISG